MYEEDTVQLISSSRPRPKRNGRARSHDNAEEGDQLFQLSDSELSKTHKSDEAFEETAMLSDSLYGDSLPSMRAQLAASHMQHRKRKPDSDSGKGESKSLLGAPNDEEEGMTGPGLDGSTKISDYGHYRSLGGKIPTQTKMPVVMKDFLIKYSKYFKVGFLTLFMVICVILFAVNPEHEGTKHFLSLNYQPQSDLPVVYNDTGECVNDTVPYSWSAIHHTYDQSKHWKFVTVDITGPFVDYPCNNSNSPGIEDCENYLFVCGVPSNYEYYCSYLLSPDSDCDDQCPNEWCHSFQLVDDYNELYPYKDYNKFTKTLRMPKSMESHDDDDPEPWFTIQFMTVMDRAVEFEATVKGEVLDDTYQVIIAAIILVWVYVLIGFDIVHRTMAAFIGSTCTLGVLSMIDKRPTLDEVVEWIDLDTICLLFGMMTLVGIFSQTGFFDYSAVKAYKLARGKVWPLITLLCLFSAVVSAFLDNVTTILLLTPVSIRLCQVLNLDPRPVLIAEVVFSNIGGTATAIGDPPNVIIISNDLIKEHGITFPEFTLHLFLGIIPAMVAAYILLSLIYFVSFIRVKNKDPPHVAELKREVAIWERTAQRLNVVSLEERAVRDAILAKAMDVRNQLSQEVNVTMHSSKDMWQKNLAELESKYHITNWVLLIKSTVVLVVVIIMFFLSNIIPSWELELGWIAIFGGIVLLLLSDIQDLESVLHKIEWGTLLFFAGLFVLMEGLGELGLIRFIGDTIVSWIEGVPQEHQMLVAILLVLWVSAIASSFIDNIPFTTATIPVIYDLASGLSLPIRPLVWALAMGACLGGNGTLIGASANVVCAGIAEQNGYKISFMSFLKIGFPMMLITTFTTMIYLLICHVAFDWNV